jgi:t-SNARE complex subunit (syntaxin)
MWDKRIEKLRLAIKTAEEKGQIYGHLENELADAERKFQNSIRMMRDVEKKHKKDEKVSCQFTL